MHHVLKAKPVCLLAGDVPELDPFRDDEPLVAVDPAPQSALLVWRPGLNGPCRVSQQKRSQAMALRLAAAINAAPASQFNHGTFSCPMDDRTAVEIWLQGRAGWELVMFPLTGCVALRAPQRLGREVPDAVEAEVGAAFPERWPYVPPTPA